MRCASGNPLGRQSIQRNCVQLRLNRYLVLRWKGDMTTDTRQVRSLEIAMLYWLCRHWRTTVRIFVKRNIRGWSRVAVWYGLRGG